MNIVIASLTQIKKLNKIKKLSILNNSFSFLYLISMKVESVRGGREEVTLEEIDTCALETLKDKVKKKGIVTCY